LARPTPKTKIAASMTIEDRNVRFIKKFPFESDSHDQF